jgi:ferredoxin
MPMRITVDHEACTGHGRCWSLAPEVFEADDDGYCATHEVDVPADLEEQARRAALSCPERAITISQT